MKKSKFTLVIVLGLVLCLLCGTTTTFSWFNRPEVLKGDSLSWSGDYNVTNGKDITAVTYAASEADGSVYETTQFDFSSLQNVSVPAHKTKYFCTEVKNTGAAPQSISLFLNNHDNNKLSVGVNSPLRTYRRVTSDSQTSYVSKTPCNVNEKNLYIATNVPDPTIYTMRTRKNGASDYTDKKLSGYIERMSGNYDNKAYQISYVTIPIEHDHARLGLGNGSSQEWFGSDLEITDKNNTYVFKADKSTVMKQSAQSAEISRFYSKAETIVGSKFYLSATAKGKVSYASSNIEVATVDGNGQVTANMAGKTTITVTSIGVYGDKITAKCELTVSEEPAKSPYIPIVTNMKIEGKTGNDPAVTKVYWYIKNDTQSNAVYSLGDVQISL